MTLTINPFMVVADDRGYLSQFLNLTDDCGPFAGCPRIEAWSSSVSREGLWSSYSGVPIFPTPCISAASCGE